MYIYLQYHGKYTKDIGTTVYILDSFFKTFDSCIYVTEVSFHWFLNYDHSRVARPRARGENALGKLVHIDPSGERTSEDPRAELRGPFLQKSISHNATNFQMRIPSYFREGALERVVENFFA